MTDISAGEFEVAKEAGSAGHAYSEFESDSSSPSTTFLSALLIIGLPAVFWISMLEMTNYVFSIGLHGNVRLAIAVGLIGVLSAIWSFIFVSARQRKSDALEARLNSL